jgi:redox-sensitive bicupin YhaK (pirin superfamily)
MPTPEFQAQGGRMHGFQLWVNLPGRDKMMKPRYQDVPGQSIPVVTSPDGLVRAKVIAGEALGARAVIDTRTPISYLHLTIAPGGALLQEIPASFNLFAYVISGKLLAGQEGRLATAGDAVIFGVDGDRVSLSVPTGAGMAAELPAELPAELLLIGGEPLNEPIARYGPFVMNTRAEIIEAVEDFQSGRFGRISGG